MDPIYITTKETPSSIRIITKPGNSRSKPIAVPIVAVRANREVFIIVVVVVVNRVISNENWSFDDFWQIARIDVVVASQ